MKGKIKKEPKPKEVAEEKIRDALFVLRDAGLSEAEIRKSVEEILGRWC